MTKITLSSVRGTHTGMLPAVALIVKLDYWKDTYAHGLADK